jgi:hypothetical protein
MVTWHGSAARVKFLGMAPHPGTLQISAWLLGKDGDSAWFCGGKALFSASPKAFALGRLVEYHGLEASKQK